MRRYIYDKARIEQSIFRMDEDILRQRLSEAMCKKIYYDPINNSSVFVCENKIKDMLVHGIFFKEIYG